MRRLVIIVAVALVASACDNDDEHSGDDLVEDDPQAESFTAFVIDLVRNRTTSDSDAIDASAFESLPDHDGSNEAAYSTLFE